MVPAPHRLHVNVARAGLDAGLSAVYGENTVYWMSIEVLDGAFPAARWKDAHGDALTEAALMQGAVSWHWHHDRWGVVLEIEFADEDQWWAYRRLVAVTAALDAVPDAVNGLLIYPGRGGSSGRVVPRRPRPLAGAGAMALPEPSSQLHDLTTEDLRSGIVVPC